MGPHERVLAGFTKLLGPLHVARCCRDSKCNKFGLFRGTMKKSLALGPERVGKILLENATIKDMIKFFGRDVPTILFHTVLSECEYRKVHKLTRRNLPRAIKNADAI